MFDFVADTRMNDWTADVDRRIWKAISIGMERGFLKAGDPVVVMTGWKPGSGSTNTMRIVTATEVKDKELLPPIVGISSIPSFNRIEGGVTNQDSVSSISTEGSDANVKFY